MELGTGIFLSAIFLGTVALYIATRDRWNWKKILLWPLAAAFGLSAAGGGGYYAYSKWDESRPLPPQSEYWGIKLGATLADVKFAKGEPSRATGSGPDDLFYEKSQGSIYQVRFKNGRVRLVAYHGPGAYAPSIGPIRTYWSLDDVQRKLGEPSSVSRSKDETERLMCWKQSQVCIEVRAGEIIALGIFDPEHGPLRYTEEAK